LLVARHLGLDNDEVFHNRLDLAEFSDLGVFGDCDIGLLVLLLEFVECFDLDWAGSTWLVGSLSHQEADLLFGVEQLALV
jgi:hypothetical protein